MRYSVLIPTFNAGNICEEQILHLGSQVGLDPCRVLVIDSSSTDGTADYYRKWGARVLEIPQANFDHGGTRRLGVEKLRDSEIVVLMTQDSIPVCKDAIKELVACFEDPSVGVAYGCQLPRDAAGPIESHARIYNYPEGVSQIRDLSSRVVMGLKAAFCSNSFAAYRVSALDDIGGFPESSFFGEDQIASSRMLLAGWRLMYCGSAKVVHSHGYTVVEDFKRNFDVGVFHSRNKWLINEFGHAESQGFAFVRSELKYLWRVQRILIPESLLRTITKYLGYRFGLIESYLPRALKKKLSMASYYWARGA
ncbi:MAG: rhamnosyltransferase [Gimesia sp.]|nr:rhamnosyltransferase [Gimesia sp.]